MESGNKLPLSYYQSKDVLFLGRDLLGKVLHTISGSGIITETESYKAPEDKASHAYKMRRTPRNEVMFNEGGCAYIYICYGMHRLFNVVTGPKGLPHAILIRGIMALPSRREIFGPGNVTKNLQIVPEMKGLLLNSKEIWISDDGYSIKPSDIECLPRVGIDYAEEYAKKPWRFRLKNLTKSDKLNSLKKGKT